MKNKDENIFESKVDLFGLDGNHVHYSLPQYGIFVFIELTNQGQFVYSSEEQFQKVNNEEQLFQDLIVDDQRLGTFGVFVVLIKTFL